MKLTRIPALVIIALLAVPLAACLAADPASPTKPVQGDFIADTSSMIKVVFRTLSADIKPGEFAALPKTLWRCGRKYMKLQELPDSANGIYGLMMAAEPDIWIINLFGKSGHHVVDKGPTTNCLCFVFSRGPDSVLMKLEIGNEISFFNAHGAKPLPDEKLGDINCSVLETNAGGSDLKLYLNKKTGLPIQVTRQPAQGAAEAVFYDEYVAGLKYDVSLFVPPAGIDIQDEG